jgi:hypothetical protein
MVRKYAVMARNQLRETATEHRHELGYIESIIALERAIEFTEELRTIVKWEEIEDTEGVMLVAA